MSRNLPKIAAGADKELYTHGIHLHIVGGGDCWQVTTLGGQPIATITPDDPHDWRWDVAEHLDQIARAWRDHAAKSYY